MAKASNRDVIRGIRDYLVLPLLVLAITSTLHAQLATNQCNNKNNDDTCSPDTINSICTMSSPFKNGSSFAVDGKPSEFIGWVLESRILLLGFPTQEDLRHQIFESLLGAICWGACFLFIRKGCNPEFRPKFFHEYWRGTCLSMVSIFNGSVFRAIVKRSIFPLGIFCRCFNAALSLLTPRLWSSISKSEELFICTSLYNALVVGMCWGITNTLVRRRLDPAMRNPPETFVQRHWKDVSCGALQMGTSSLLKATWMHYTPAGVVEDHLANVVAWLSGNIFSALLSPINTLMFGYQTNHESCHHLYESMRVGISWGLTSLFIRRGLNPDLRDGGRFLRKYWRDALFGAFALACCVFLKLAVRICLERIALFVENRAEHFLGDEL